MRNSNLLNFTSNHKFFLELETISENRKAMLKSDGIKKLRNKLDAILDEYKIAVANLTENDKEIYYNVYRPSIKIFDEKIRNERLKKPKINLLTCPYYLLVDREQKYLPFLEEFGPKFQSLIPEFKLPEEEKVELEKQEDVQYLNLNSKFKLRAKTQIYYFINIKGNEKSNPIYNLGDTELAAIVAPILNAKPEEYANVRSYLSALRAERDPSELLAKTTKNYLIKQGVFK